MAYVKKKKVYINQQYQSYLFFYMNATWFMFVVLFKRADSVYSTYTRALPD